MKHIQAKMSITHLVLVCSQAMLNQMACTPPNPTSEKHRYHTAEPYILQIAPTIFKCHQALIWTCTAFELLHFTNTLIYPPTLRLSHPSLICYRSQNNIVLTWPFIIGFVAVALGTYIRLDCFNTLGSLFTFDLTVLPEHKLVTTRLYSYARHPAYSGSLLLIFGLACSHLSKGSWLTECGPLSIVPGSNIVMWAAWWVWAVSVAVSRAQAEDRQMQQMFPDEWAEYARNVPWWFFPGIF